MASALKWGTPWPMPLYSGISPNSVAFKAHYVKMVEDARAPLNWTPCYGALEVSVLLFIINTFCEWNVAQRI